MGESRVEVELVLCEDARGTLAGVRTHAHHAPIALPSGLQGRSTAEKSRLERIRKGQRLRSRELTIATRLA